MMTLVLNGWASSPEAWSLCDFAKADGARLFSYAEQLDGGPGRALAACDEVVLVGWSMGASGALRLACAAPEKVRGLVLVAPTPRMMEERVSGWIGMSPRRLKALEMGLKLTHGGGFFGTPEGLPNPYLMDSDANLARGLDYLRETDLRAPLESTFGAAHPPKFPVFIFQSEADGIVRSENAAYLKEKVFPDATVEMIPGAEHALPIRIPEKIDAAVACCRAASMD